MKNDDGASRDFVFLSVTSDTSVTTFPSVSYSLLVGAFSDTVHL